MKATGRSPNSGRSIEPIRELAANAPGPDDQRPLADQALPTATHLDDVGAARAAIM